MSTLFPGYKHVSSFSSGDVYESEEEVSYLTLDLGSIEPTLVPSSNEYRLIGLDTPTPFLQLSGTVFRGKHKSLLGTEILFAQGPSIPPQTSNPNAQPTTSPLNRLEYLTTTSKRIQFEEVQLIPKVAGEDEDEGVSGPVGKTLGDVGIETMLGEGKAKDKGPRKETKASKGKGKTKGKRKGKEREEPEPMDVDVLAPSQSVVVDEGNQMELDQG